MCIFSIRSTFSRFIYSSSTSPVLSHAREWRSCSSIQIKTLALHTYASWMCLFHTSGNDYLDGYSSFFFLLFFLKFRAERRANNTIDSQMSNSIFRTCVQFINPRKTSIRCYANVVRWTAMNCLKWKWRRNKNITNKSYDMYTWRLNKKFDSFERWKMAKTTEKPFLSIARCTFF